MLDVRPFYRCVVVANLVHLYTRGCLLLILEVADISLDFIVEVRFNYIWLYITELTKLKYKINLYEE